MNFLEGIKGAIQSLKGNKMRSFLTMLGIIIGITSVITMSAIGKGGQQSITGDLKDNGYGKFTVSVDTSDESFRWKYLLDPETVKEIKNTNLFKNVTPSLSNRVFMSIGRRNEMVMINASTRDYESMEKIKLMAGRNFLPKEYEVGERIVTIDNATAISMFGSEQDAVGKEINFSPGRQRSEVTYTVVGVFENPLGDLIKVMGGTRIPRFMRTPMSTYERLFDLSTGGYNSILVESLNPEKSAEDMKRMNELLEELKGVKGLYQVQSTSNAAATFDNILSTLNMFVTFVAGISLFVGGIGVMNIMLVSVIERTKEIGIRKAIGATNRDILSQFLLESIILTFTGGIVGLIFGIGLAIGVGQFVKIKPMFTMTSILLSLGVSTLIGIVFGVAPARKASNLNPIDALRAE